MFASPGAYQRSFNIDSKKSNKAMSPQMLSPNSFQTREILEAGLKFYVLGRYPSAVRSYRRALSQEPDSALGHYLLGLALMACGDAFNARNEWESARRLEHVDASDGWAGKTAVALLGVVSLTTRAEESSGERGIMESMDLQQASDHRLLRTWIPSTNDS